MSVSSKDSRLDLEFLSVSEIETYLRTLDEFKDCPEDLISEMAVEVTKWVESCKMILKLLF